MPGDRSNNARMMRAMTQAPSPMSEPLMWNLVSGGYVSENVPLFTEYANDVIRLAKIGPGSLVGDVACGPGTLSFVAASLGAHVRALDFAEDMIARLHERAASEEQTLIEATVGDGQSLPWNDAELDAAFSMFGLMFFPDRGRGFRELHRVLKPGGRAFVTSWVPFDRVPVMAAVLESLRVAMPNMPFGASKAPLGDAEEMRNEFEAAGFRDVQTQTLKHELVLPDAEALWTSLQKSLAPLVLVKHKLGEGFAPLGDKIFAELKRLLPGGPVRAEMIANLGIGTR